MRTAPFALVVLLAAMPQIPPRVDTHASITHDVPSNAPGNPERLVFKVDDKLSFRGSVDLSESAREGVLAGRAVAGRVDGGTFSMIEEGKQRFARVHVADKVYRFATSPDGLRTDVTVTETSGQLECGAGRRARRIPLSAPALGEDDCRDASEMPEGACYEATMAMAKDAARTTGLCKRNELPQNGTAVIEALVLYARNVRAAHTRAEIRNETLLSLGETNEAFALSRLDARIRLATRGGTPCLFPIDYAEDDEAAVNLKRLLTKDDQFLDSVPVLRRQCKADVVFLLVRPSHPDASGMTCVMKGVRSYAPYAQAVVNYESMPISFVFTHELGHMLGAGHDRTDQCRMGLCPYSAGLVLTIGGTKSRTMMGLTGERLPNFSDPSIVLPDGTPLGGRDADNARTLRLTVGSVSNFN